MSLPTTFAEVRAQFDREPAPADLLPCTKHLPDIAAAIAACDSTDGTKLCNRWFLEEHSNQPHCPRVVRARNVEHRIANRRRIDRLLSTAHVGERLAGLHRAAVPRRCNDQGEEIPSVPLIETEALGKVREFMDSAGWCLVLASAVGAGKSVAASFPLARVEGLMIVASDLEAIDYDMARATSAGLLVIDDMGTEHSGATGFVLSRLEKLINARYAADAKTIITTNLRRVDFSKRYGGRIDDRLREGGVYVELRGKSLRGAL